MSRARKATNPLCVAGDVECNLGRCPACELRRLRALADSNLETIQQLRRERSALKWGLSHVSDRSTDERVISFVEAVLSTLDANPEHLKLLRGET